jgi:hypothetical protein
VLLAGCALPLEERLISEGIGTELPAEDIAESTRRLDIYLSFLCQQARMFRVEGDGEVARVVCDMSTYGPASLAVMVRAGFNDIDRRCDSYLAWLNSRRRNRAAVLSQITDARNFTEALLYTTGVSATPLTIVGLAFGVASNTFTNYYSRLLLEIEKSTVEVLVHEKRLQYRNALNTKIVTLPDAIHVLREYLLICTPHYIENRINQRTRDSVAGNEPSDDQHADRIRETVSAGLIGSIPQGGARGGFPPPPPVTFITGGETDVERKIALATGVTIQLGLCVPGANGNFGPATREAIKQAKLGDSENSVRRFGNLEGKITTRGELDTFSGLTACAGNDRLFKTAFERFAFAGPNAIKGLQLALGSPFCSPGLKQTGEFDEATRAALKKVTGSETLSSATYQTVKANCV